MDLSVRFFDLRDAIEELREERDELLKRIEALEALALRPEDKDQQDQRDNAANKTRPSVVVIRKPSESVQEREEKDKDKNHIGCTTHSAILPEGGSR